MPKYRIERQYIFSKKSEKEINQFLNQYEGTLNLAEVKDQKGNTALHQCAYFNLPTLLNRYLSYMEQYVVRASIPNPTNFMYEFINMKNNDDLSAIHYAAYKGHPKIIEILDKYDGDVYAKTVKTGQNVLHIAAQNNKVETFLYFQYTLDLNSRDKKGATPLHWASSSNSQYVVIYLLAQKGIDFNAQDSNLRTPLHYAAAYGNTKIVKKLLRAGADRTLVNDENEKPIDIAQKNQFPNIMKLLKQHDSLIDSIKLCMNLKTEYRPQKKSIVKPIIFIFLHLLFYTIRCLFIEPDFRDNSVIFYVETVFYGFILLCYLSLLKPETTKSPKTYNYFLNALPNIPINKVCLICIREKPFRSAHCDVCHVCVGRYDHHCYWINNCVGQYNLGRFLCFVISFLFFLVYLGSLGFAILYNIIKKNNSSIFYPKENLLEKIIGGVFGSACIIVFAIFIIPMVMLASVQIKNVFLNKTTYERFTKDKISSFSESNSHIISEEIKRNVKQRNRKWSLKNATKMICQSETEASQQRINGSGLQESLQSES